MAECKVPKSCNLCGEAGHLYRSCPQRQASYAAAARATPKPPGETSTSKPAQSHTDQEGQTPQQQAPSQSGAPDTELEEFAQDAEVLLAAEDR